VTQANTLGWFNSSPSLQGRVGVSPNTATQVKLGQFIISQSDTSFRTYTLRTAYNNGTGGGVVFADGSFSLGFCTPQVWSRDLDGDGFGNAADGTLTQCGQPAGYVLNNTDNCPTIANPGQEDCDGDGIGNACDGGGLADCNSNGTPDACEIFAGTLRDCDGDFIPDTCEGAVIIAQSSPLSPISGAQPISYTFTNLPRAFGVQPRLRIEARADLGGATDGLLVSIEGAPATAYFGSTGTDCPTNPDVANITWSLAAFNALVADGQLSVQISAFGAVNSAGCTNGGVRVFLDYDGLPTIADCNANGLLDSCEIGTGAQPDCNANGKPDACDIASGYASDCNANGVPDTCDIASGTSTDLNANGKPDECSGEFIVGGSGFANIQAAITAAPDGATIRVGAGTYGPVVLSGRQLTLQSLAGAATTFIDGGGATRCVNFVTPGVGPSLIEGFTLRNGRAGNGAAINVVGATLEIRACVFRDNTSTNAGGAVSALDSNVTIFDSEFRNNTAVRGGAIHSEVDLTNALVQVVGCFITENTASTDGGAISNAGNIRVRECVIVANAANAAGGGLWTQPGSISELLGVQFCRNTPENVDGAFVDLGGNIFSGDCDADGVCDADEITSGAEQDCNANGILDACEITSGADFDCNANGVLDSCDIAAGTSNDVDSNAIPDDCQPDCDGDALPDTWELSQGLAFDCDANDIPDNCDIASGADDKNANGELDACEFARGDLNLDGVINAADLAVLLAFWGVPNPPVGDLDGDGTVNGADLATLLVNWGT
jgi:hypothetical protein